MMTSMPSVEQEAQALSRLESILDGIEDARSSLHRVRAERAMEALPGLAQRFLTLARRGYGLEEADRFQIGGFRPTCWTLLRGKDAALYLGDDARFYVPSPWRDTWWAYAAALVFSLGIPWLGMEQWQAILWVSAGLGSLMTALVTRYRPRVRPVEPNGENAPVFADCLVLCLDQALDRVRFAAEMAARREKEREGNPDPYQKWLQGEGVPNKVVTPA